MWRSVLIGVALSLALPCASALAASVRISERTGYLVFRAGAGERNDLRVAIFEQESTGAHHFVDFEVEDSVPVATGSGCEPAPTGRRHFVRCRVDLPGNLRVVAALGDQDDRARVVGEATQQAVVSGGRGNDTLSGGPEADGLVGGAGADVLAGGGGLDTLIADSAPREFVISYPPTLTLAGTSRDAGDRLLGGAGADWLIGSAGDNVLAGGPDADYVQAGSGRDRILERDLAVDYVTCGAGLDVTRNDPFDFLSSCERASRLSGATTVPLAFDGDSTFADTWLKVLVGCRPSAPGPCAGTLRAEVGGTPAGPERPFEVARGGFVTVDWNASERIRPETFERDDFVVAISSGGVTTRTPARRLQHSWNWWL